MKEINQEEKKVIQVIQELYISMWFENEKNYSLEKFDSAWEINFIVCSAELSGQISSFYQLYTKQRMKNVHWLPCRRNWKWMTLVMENNYLFVFCSSCLSVYLLQHGVIRVDLDFHYVRVFSYWFINNDYLSK